jgi:hypothetical protein
MREKCSVCKDENPRRDMKYLDPIDDWICTDCLKQGHEYGVRNLEDGKDLTKRIREE